VSQRQVGEHHYHQRKGPSLKEDIERMIREAEEFSSEDEAQRKRIEALNALSSFIYGSRRSSATLKVSWQDQ